MPPIPTTFALCTPAPSVTLDPNSTGQGTPLMSQFLLGTGSFLVAVIALVLVSVARYFYHGRGTVNHTRTGKTWIPLAALPSSIRHRGSPMTFKAAATSWPVDVEIGLQHDVSIVYARFFHPTFWNANKNPVPDLNPPGVNSFSDMVDQVGRHGVKEVPLYDMISPTSVSFSSEIIGTTVHQGTILSVLCKLEDDLSETSPADSELDFPGSPHDGILTIDSEPDFACSPHDGISTVNSEPGLGCSPYDGISTTDSESQFCCSPYDGIVMTTPTSFSGACVRRHGVVDMTHLAQNLKDTISEEGYPLVPVIPCRAGLLDLPSFADMDPTPPCGSLQELDPADEESTTNYDNGVHDTPEALVDGSIDVNIPEAPHSGGDWMRLCDPDLDCTPRSPSEDSDDDEEGAFTGSPCRHQLWAPLFRCRSRDKSALARTTVRYSMIAVSHPHPLRSSHSSLIVVSVLSRLENLRRSYRTTRLTLLSLFPAPSHPLPRCLLSFYAHLDVAGNLNCVC
ncbi:hypothetical protein EV363DRAFT_1345620 [Boletus edulis]|nr:hypothetical protein EV363DRAFT_1345620 [Boletus edulis]